MLKSIFLCIVLFVRERIFFNIRNIFNSLMGVICHDKI